MNDELARLSPFERDAVSKILEEDAPDLVPQLSHLQVEKREHTGVGAYIYFCCAETTNALNGDDRTLGTKAFAEIKGLHHGAGLVLYVDDGLISMLEIFSHAGEEIPLVIEGETK